MHSLQNHGWHVDTQIEHGHLDDVQDSPTPQMLSDLKRALIIRNSHIGGHKFAGNVIVTRTLVWQFQFH